MVSFQAIYKIGDDVIDNRILDESQISVALQYGKEIANRQQKDLEVTIIQQTVITYNIPHDVRKTNGKYIPPRTDDSPSVCEILNRGD